MAKVTVRFTVVSFAPQGSCLAVVGGSPELGDWNVDQAKTMQPSLGHGRLQSEPDLHWVDVEFPADVKSKRLDFKFIEKSGGSARWEELGSSKNRVLELDNEQTPAGVVLLPVQRFGEGMSGESDHTGRFYQGVKERKEISVRKVLSNLFVGSCPRQKSHIDYLKSLGITTVVNFQTEDDCRRNCVEGIGMEDDPLAVSQLYEAQGMEYIWLPTFDMSTDGRAQMLPYASHIFASLLSRGHVVYSHCNAGVGRSVAAACGYISFALGLSFRQMQHIVASGRPVAFFDFEALGRAKPHYDAMFGRAIAADALDKFKDEALTTLSRA
mmetsp:Transcript_24557/g.56636  ORF Transcript_24557/g.56636 Transcript_24557/m.56636 type:complete len:325 (+) Transcript_24557:57-1031(+)|eukprot:1097595-Amphidinium_carterae.1